MQDDRSDDLQRVSDADRDAATTMLRTAFEEGRLAQDEHAERVDAALGARTRGELETLVTDLAATGESHPERPHRSQKGSEEVESTDEVEDTGEDDEGSRLSPLAVWGIFSAVMFFIWAVPALVMGYPVGVLGWALFCGFWGIPPLIVTLVRRRRS